MLGKQQGTRTWVYVNPKTGEFLDKDQRPTLSLGSAHRVRETDLDSAREVLRGLDGWRLRSYVFVRKPIFRPSR